MAKKAQTVPVTIRALVQRINRRLERDGEMLKKSRTARDQQNLGDYFTIDVSINGVTGKRIDPEALGRELGVLRPYEHVED